MTKIPSVEERVEEFMSQYAWGKFFTIELEQEVRENLLKTLTAEREAGAKEAAVEKYQAISTIMNNLLSSDVTKIARDIYNYRDRADSQIEALTPPTK
jgi:hypothetical protein